MIKPVDRPILEIAYDDGTVDTLTMIPDEVYNVQYMNMSQITPTLVTITGKFVGTKEPTPFPASNIVGRPRKGDTLVFDCSANFKSQIECIYVEDIRNISRQMDTDFLNTVFQAPGIELEKLYIETMEYLNTFIGRTNLSTIENATITIIGCKEAINIIRPKEDYSDEMISINLGVTDSYAKIYKVTTSILYQHFFAINCDFIEDDNFGKSEIVKIIVNNSTNPIMFNYNIMSRTKSPTRATPDDVREAFYFLSEKASTIDINLDILESEVGTTIAGMPDNGRDYTSAKMIQVIKDLILSNVSAFGFEEIHSKVQVKYKSEVEG